MTDKAQDIPVETGTASAQAPAPAVWAPFETLRREVDRAFDAFHRGGWRLPLAGWPSEPGLPEFRGFMGADLAVDVAEKDDAYEITAELPGVKAEAIEVSLAGGRLTLKAEKKEDKRETDKGRHVSERRYGSFMRSFQLPDGVNHEAIKATHENGVLKIILPKSAEARAAERKIEVRAA